MRNIILIILIPLFLPQRISPSDIIEILAPDKRINTNNDKIHIIGKTSANIVEILLNDKKVGDVKIKDGHFHYQINYGYGLHEVKFIPIFSGKPELENEYTTVEIMYAPLIEKKYKRLYPDYIFHDEKSKPECVECHKCEFDNLSEVNDAATCLDCHSSLIEKFSKHTKADDKTCILCHELGLKLQGIYAGNDFAQNPCFKCHDDKIKSFDQEYVHGPVAGGSCVICHNPHGSVYEKSLNVPERLLCVSCHEDIEDEMNALVLHEPFVKGQCSGCHNPHSTNNEWVLKKSSEEVCLNCHEQQGTLQIHRHPFNVKPKKKLAADLVLTSDGNLECLSCHSPHSSKQIHLLKAENEFTCMDCHMDML